MTAKGFRIGNYFYNENNNVSIVRTIGIGQINDFDVKEFKPIHLTEEWILRFGWLWNDECKSFEKPKHINMNLEYVKINNSYTMFNYVTKALIRKRIWYVHQLQNLYFALTGEELITNNQNYD